MGAGARVGERSLRAARSLALEVPADEVWALIGPFDAIPRMHPIVASCEVEPEPDSGATVRRIRLKDGGEIVNRLTECDDAARFYRYTIVTSPFPVREYDCTLRVRETGPGACVVEWWATFEPAGASADEVTRIFTDMMDDGLARVGEALSRARAG